MESVNYFDIHKRLEESYIHYFDTQQKLVGLMEKFITNGLHPVTNNKSGKRKKK